MPSGDRTTGKIPEEPSRNVSGMTDSEYGASPVSGCDGGARREYAVWRMCRRRLTRNNEAQYCGVPTSVDRLLTGATPGCLRRSLMMVKRTRVRGHGKWMRV